MGRVVFSHFVSGIVKGQTLPNEKTGNIGLKELEQKTSLGQQMIRYVTWLGLGLTFGGAFLGVDQAI